MNNKYMREYMAKRYKSRRDEFIAFLGSKCVKCGSMENLEFDHIDKNKKRFEIAKIILGNKERVLEEIEKCQLLCHACHEEKTIIDVGKKRAKGFHGTLSSHNHCKCDLCKKAKADYMKSYNKKSAFVT